MIEVKCKRCGKIFETYLYRIKDGRGKYCSKKCQYGNSKMKKKCIVCGKDYIIYKHREDTAKCCSKKCWYGYNKGKNSILFGKELSEETKKKMRKAKKGYKPSKETREKWSKVRKGRKTKPCSEEKKIKIGNANRGKNNWNWKGGITPFRIRIWRSSNYKIWRLSVFERDNFICQMPDCDKIERILNAHHIKLFNEIMSENNIKTVEEAIACQELWNLDNGITLCKKCHKKIRQSEQKYITLFQEIIKLK